MGGNKYQASDAPKRTVSEKFVTWLNGISFTNDDEAAQALTEIKAECNVRLDLIAEEETAD